MSSLPKKSRWEDESDEEVQQQKKKQKKEKKKTHKQRLESPAAASPPVTRSPIRSSSTAATAAAAVPRPFLRECRHVDCFEQLNKIEEGSYGIVYRARDRSTGDIVALKKLKLDKEKNGFPVTSLREIYALLNVKHPNIVNVREIVMGNRLDQ